MITYEVHVEVRPDLAAAFETYMRERHIPQILATGCFAAISFEWSEEGRYRTRYQADSQADLDRYLQQHTEGFRADFLAHFPEGCSASRGCWVGVEDWRR